MLVVKKENDVTTYEIGILAVTSVGCGRYQIGTFESSKHEDAMAVLIALKKLPRPVAVSMGERSWWVHEGDLLFVAPVALPPSRG